MVRKALKNSANDLYDFYQYPEELHSYRGLISITLGIHDLITEENCSWILDVILENQQTLSDHNIQIWKLYRIGQDTFNLTCSTDNGEVIFTCENQKFKSFWDYLQIIKKGYLLCLPVERNIY